MMGNEWEQSRKMTLCSTIKRSILRSRFAHSPIVGLAVSIQNSISIELKMAQMAWFHSIGLMYTEVASFYRCIKLAE